VWRRGLTWQAGSQVNSNRWIVVGVVLIAAFFVLPAVPWHYHCAYSVFAICNSPLGPLVTISSPGQGVELTAQVSPSFYLFNCGIVWDAKAGQTTLWDNGAWVCGNVG